ncbi:DUF4190 domain-containing protein [Actinomycetospora sp. CA-101289]|uniref:DUF4190 domain-containing protein n=1 Tax=Actinomycetospora sp. CA-101289 TaxID=3239893 RepID=UPI003D99AF9B
MSQQPPHPHAPGGQEAPTVSLRSSATYGPPPPLHGGGAAAGPPTGTNLMAILSVVFAFVFSPLGIVFGIVGRGQTRRTGQPGRGLATFGLVLSVVFLVVGVAATLYLTVLAAQFASSVPVDVPDQPAVSAPADPTEPADPSGPVATGPAGTATVGVADGDYGPEVPSEALAEQVGAQTGATDVICPGYLPAQVDASTTCSGTLDGQQAQLDNRVTGVEGAEATVEITRVG